MARVKSNLSVPCDGYHQLLSFQGMNPREEDFKHAQIGYFVKGEVKVPPPIEEKFTLTL